MGIWSAAKKAVGSFANTAIGAVGKALGQPERGYSEAVRNFIAPPVKAAEIVNKSSGGGGGSGGGSSWGGGTPTYVPPSGGGGGPTPEQQQQAQEVINQGYDPNWRARALQEGKDVNSPEFSSLREMESAYNQATSVPSVPSAEEAARRAAEERMARFNKLVVPVQKDVETFLKGRRSLSDMFQEQLTAQNIPEQENVLKGYETDEAKLQGDLATIPAEDIARRRETGMISAAAERRIKAAEERPIREQLLGVSTAKSTQSIGLQRAYDLVDKWLTIFQEQEKRQIEPLTQRLSNVSKEFEIESDNIASQLTGFNEDRKAALTELQAQLDERRTLNRDQQQEYTDLRQLEIEHAYEMEKLLAEQRGEKPREFEVEAKTLGQLRDAIIAGGTLRDIAGQYITQGVEPDVILNLYNLNNKNNEQISSEQFRSEYGVTSSSKQIPSAEEGGGSPI